jgi:hypothetical protein
MSRRSQSVVGTFVSLVLGALVGTVVLTSSLAVAAETSALPPVATSSVSSETLVPSLAAPQIGDVFIKAGLKSTNTSGRRFEYDSTSGRRYRLKNEYYLGGELKSGWGLSVMAVTSGKSVGDGKKDAFGAGDPSVTLSHPAIYDHDGTRVWGQFRRYFAGSDYAKDRGQKQYAYYLYSFSRLSGGWTVFNQLTPRYFDQPAYGVGETNYFVEDYTNLAKKMSSWLRLGVGQHSQVEWHKDSATGTCVEIYPYADLVLSSNVFIEPRLVLPVSKQNSVYDSPNAVALDNAQAEIYVQISI